MHTNIGFLPPRLLAQDATRQKPEDRNFPTWNAVVEQMSLEPEKIRHLIAANLAELGLRDKDPVAAACRRAGDLR